MSEPTFQLVEYRNAIYQGGFSKGRREGKGILITDSGQIFVGTWKNDFLNDKALIWLSEKMYVIGDFNRGLMDGQFIYRDNKSLFYAEFTNNKLTGRMVYFDESERDRKARCLQYKNLNYHLINQRHYAKGDERHVFREFLGYDNMSIPELRDFIKTDMVKDGTYAETVMPLGSTYIGFNKGDTVEKLGFIVSKDQLVSFGVYVNKVLDGFGCRFENGIRTEGYFKAGFLNGFGLKYNTQQNKYTFGYFDKGTLKEMNDFGDAEQDSGPNMALIKKEMHIKSIYFFNSFVKSSTMLKYRGYEETMYRSTKPQKEYLMPDTTSSKIRMKSEPEEDFPVLRKMQSQRRPQVQQRIQYSSRIGPSKLQEAPSIGKQTSRRKLFDQDTDINPERDFKGANSALRKFEESMTQDQKKKEMNTVKSKRTWKYDD